MLTSFLHAVNKKKLKVWTSDKLDAEVTVELLCCQKLVRTTVFALKC